MIGFVAPTLLTSPSPSPCTRRTRMCSAESSRAPLDVTANNSKPANLQDTTDRTMELSAYYEQILREDSPNPGVDGSETLSSSNDPDSLDSDDLNVELSRLEKITRGREYSSEYIASRLMASMAPTTIYSEDEDLGIQSVIEDDDSIDENDFENAVDDLFDTSSNEIGSSSGISDRVPVVSSEELFSKLAQIKHRRQAFRNSDSTVSTRGSAENDLGAEGESLSMSLRDIKNSMRTAKIVPPASESTDGPYNALTSMAEVIARERSQFPFVAEPVLELQNAFVASESVPCKVCGAAVPKSEIELDLCCGMCFSKIFVEVGAPGGELKVDKMLKGLPADVRASVQRIRAERRKRIRRLSGRVIPPNRQESVWEMKGSSAPSTQPGHTLERSPLNREDSPPNPPDSPPPPSHTNGSSAERSDEWEVRASNRSLRTVNPIRNLVQGIDVKPNPSMDVIKLSVGDPTVYGNLKVSSRAIDAYCDAIRSMKHHGYSMSMGSLEARTAVAERYMLPNAPLTADDVVLTSGTSGAIEVAIGALANEGDNILLPRPGFPLFRTIAEGFGVECRSYNLLPNQEWEIDLKKLPALVDNRTVAIVVNNPSNPCGSVYTKRHIQEILKAAAELHLPVIADEVYADMVFSGRDFTPMGSESVDVPVLSVGGISKQFVVPGWRLGWILIHDRHNIFEKGNIRRGIRQLTTRMLVPNSPAQAVVPTMLQGGVLDESFRSVMSELELNATFTVKALASAPGLRCIAPQGAMYTMAEVDVELLGFEDDMAFTKALLAEESVFVLPGQCFQAPNFVRIVFCAPHFVLSEAYHRIRRFCKKHAGVSRF